MTLDRFKVELIVRQLGASIVPQLTAALNADREGWVLRSIIPDTAGIVLCWERQAEASK